MTQMETQQYLKLIVNILGSKINHFKSTPEEKINRLIQKFNSKTKSFYFIQIGSNDGKTGDPINRFIKQYKWRGVLIEPVPHIFNKLKKTYKNMSGIVFVNAAIGNVDGFKSFYCIKKPRHPNDPFWYDQLGSFKKAVIEKHRSLIPQFAKRLIKTKVKCITLSNLIVKYSISNVDLLHIDTEGYDYEIIKQIPFDTISPKMIFYEHRHLKDVEIRQCIELLKSKGYKFIKAESDTFAYKKNV